MPPEPWTEPERPFVKRTCEWVPPGSTRLTAKQAAVLAFVRRHERAFGRRPSLRAVCREFGWASPHAARTYLKVLRRKGAL